MDLLGRFFQETRRNGTSSGEFGPTDRAQPDRLMDDAPSPNQCLLSRPSETTLQVQNFVNSYYGPITKT
jgi:hypothetical protein